MNGSSNTRKGCATVFVAADIRNHDVDDILREAERELLMLFQPHGFSGADSYLTVVWLG
jgi:hypothetical protein